MADEQAAHPARRATDAVLRDGSTVHIRPIRPDDEQRLFEFLRALSESSRVFRFFSAPGDHTLSNEARRDAHIDYRHRFGLVATTGPEERIVGHSVYATIHSDVAEAAFAVADEYQGRGLGTILLGHLAETASAQGVQQFVAFVLPGNTAMVRVFRESGFPTDIRHEGGELTVTFPTSLTEEALARFDRREQVAAMSALRAFFAPRAIAVVGASRRRGTFGGEVFHNLLAYKFAGPVYPVNPRAAVVQNVPAFPSVEAIPGPVDLAVVAVPAAEVAQVAEQCAHKGVRALLVISAGFAEIGGEGQARQAELMRICRAAGIRLIGPNCMGAINTDPSVRLNATFAPTRPPAGRVGFSSQSGALGLAILDYASALGLGLSTFVSVGDKADISGNDLINYWETDPHTDVILLYLESFGNPRKFSRIARRVGRVKPIVAVKSGRSQAGARATSSHTGALLAASDLTVDALFRQAGVIRTDTLEELFDVASFLAHQTAPNGRRVGIITNGGGPGILCADTCDAEGLEVPLLGENTQSKLRALLPAEAAVSNPVDMIASATPDHYREAIRIVAGDPVIDSLVVIFVPPLVTRPEDVGRAIAEAVRPLHHAKPVVTVFMSTRGVPETLRSADVRVPSYTFPESAAIALARAARYGEWRARPLGAPPRFEDRKRDVAMDILVPALGRGDGWLTQDETHALLSCYGLPTAPQATASTPEDAGTAAERLGGEIALKALGPTIVHKTDLGALRLGLRGADETRAAATHMATLLTLKGAAPEAFLVQAMARKGVEMIVGVVHDPQFGPVVACGAGGTMVELLKDVSIRLTPLTSQDASEMLRELRTYPLLTGFRGAPRADVEALEDALLRISAMVEDLHQIVELDCNPIIVHEHGATVVDARVRVAASEPSSLLARRR
jgi:acetyl coenzyme A synthetase (ADP forming)-like protein